MQRAARRDQAQDHRDRAGVGSPSRHGRRRPAQRRERRPDRASAAASWPGCASAAKRRFPRASTTATRSPRCTSASTRSQAGEEAPGTLPRRGPGHVAPRARQARLPDLKDGSGQLQLLRHASTRSAPRPSSGCLDVDVGDFVGAEGAVLKTRRGELSLRVDRLAVPVQGAAAAAREVPRPDRRRDALPPALPRH